MTSFEELYQTHFKSVYAYVFARVRNAAAAEDICASVWKKCYEHFASFDETKGVFGQWLFGIARNETNMYGRLFWVKHIFSLPDTEDEFLAGADPTPPEKLEEKAFRAGLLRALGRLSDKERDLISLKFYSGLNNRQIAAVTKLTETNVGTLLHRAVQKLRRYMELV